MPRTELLASGGDHLRYVSGPLARAMVAAGAAEIANQIGKMRSVRLTIGQYAYHPLPSGVTSRVITQAAKFTLPARTDIPCDENGFSFEMLPV
jgi:hypothetical protein